MSCVKTQNMTDTQEEKYRKLLNKCIDTLPNYYSSYLRRMVDSSKNLIVLQTTLEELLHGYDNGASNDDGFLQFEAILLGILLYITKQTSEEFTSESLFSIALDETADYDEELFREALCLQKYVKYKDAYHIESFKLPISKEEWTNLPEKRGRKDKLIRLCESRKIKNTGTVKQMEERLKEWSETQLKINEHILGEQKEIIYKIISEQVD